MKLYTQARVHSLQVVTACWALAAHTNSVLGSSASGVLIVFYLFLISLSRDANTTVRFCAAANGILAGNPNATRLRCPSSLMWNGSVSYSASVQQHQNSPKGATSKLKHSVQSHHAATLPSLMQ